MDEELKKYLDEKFARIDAGFARIDARFAQIDARFAQIDAKFERIDVKFEGIDAKFATKEDLERVETSLLTEFHKWASPVDMRAKTHTALIRSIDIELEALADRVQKLENRPH